MHMLQLPTVWYDEEDGMNWINAVVRFCETWSIRKVFISGISPLTESLCKKLANHGIEVTVGYYGSSVQHVGNLQEEKAFM